MTPPPPLSATVAAFDDPRVRRDLKLLARFIQVYCDGKHRDAARAPVALRHVDVDALARRRIRLCPACSRLLVHAFMKRAQCPLDPKPQCKHCPQHCYAPDYRAQIRAVMKYSGRKLVLSGRLDYLIHLFW